MDKNELIALVEARKKREEWIMRVVEAVRALAQAEVADATADPEWGGSMGLQAESELVDVLMEGLVDEE